MLQVELEVAEKNGSPRRFMRKALEARVISGEAKCAGQFVPVFGKAGGHCGARCAAPSHTVGLPGPRRFVWRRPPGSP